MKFTANTALRNSVVICDVTSINTLALETYMFWCGFYFVDLYVQLVTQLAILRKWHLESSSNSRLVKDIER